MSESESNDPQNLIIQFLQVAYQKDVDGFSQQEDATFLTELIKLSPDQRRDLALVMAGRKPIKNDFYENIKELGWYLEKDNNNFDDSQGAPLGKDEHGYPYIGVVAQFPNGVFSMRFQDLVRIVSKENMIQELFGIRPTSK